MQHESRFSGPPPGAENPFSSGAVDAAFMCAPPFFWLLESGVKVELLGVAPIFDDSRCEAQPVYFADVVTRAAGAATFEALRGGVWAYNDACSLSGYYCLLEHLHALGEDKTFFRQLSASGSHGASLELVLGGQADAAAIDSNVLRLAVAAYPELREQLKILTSWGHSRCNR